ncbi:ABC transporter ATP-binding protein [Desulfobacter vibrioformis]|uniref:ABC transporter ATP-binding protein n=1 Tax=Desulfobacter vibrioformis TaxID=34031 RepID=UPI00054F2968|nr:ABC transporter ATP-binding protein [Desulfobacter vibrioformis]
MLKIKNLKCCYGNIAVVHTVSLSVRQGELISIIGANGAGKSTLLGAVCGLLKNWSGEIEFKGRSLKGMSAPAIVSQGISMVPEGRQIFSPLSVMDNLKMGAYTRFRKEGKTRVAQDLDRVVQMFPILRERSDQLAGTLSGGEQQMLAIGRALMARPALLVLDEPSMGLAPKIVGMIFETIQTLRDTGVTILLVEQNARAALKIADRGYVLETGKMVLQGSADELLVDDDVKRAYLGKDYGDFLDGRNQ